jgi:hypothetical protein
VRARARRVPCSVHPMERPPATTTSAPRPPTGLRAATARGTTTPAFCCFVNGRVMMGRWRGQHTERVFRVVSHEARMKDEG